MLQDDLIRVGKKAALAEFRRIVEGQCQATDLYCQVNEVKDAFTKAVAAKAVEMGFNETDACFYAFNGWDLFRGELTQECRREMALIQKEHTANQIRSVLVECLIEPKIREAALPYCIEYQKYRLKICVRIDYKRHLEFYVRYRDFNDDSIIDGIPEMIRRNVRYIQEYGPQISQKANDSHMDWKKPENKITI